MREFSRGLKRPRREADHVVPRVRLSGAVTPFSHIRLSSWLAVMTLQFSVNTTHTGCTEPICRTAGETEMV